MKGKIFYLDTPPRFRGKPGLFGSDGRFPALFLSENEKTDEEIYEKGENVQSCKKTARRAWPKFWAGPIFEKTCKSGEPRAPAAFILCDRVFHNIALPATTVSL